MAPPLISLTELLNPRSAQQVINDFFAYLANPPDPKLVSVRTANWRTGGPYRFLAYRQGIEASLLYQVIAGFAGSSFLRYAAGRWLDWLGQDFFGEPRQGATFATATLAVNIPAGAGPYGPLQLTAQTTNGKSFSSTSLVTLPAGPATTFMVPVKAAQAGAAYNVAAGAISQLITPNVLGISVTNPANAIGGFDAEPDSRYRQRLAAKLGVLSTGSTQAAYLFWALTASPEVQKVRVYSDLNLGTYEDQCVTVVVSSLTGPVTSPALAAVDAYIRPLVPLNVTLYTANAAIRALSVTGLVKVFTAFYATARAGIANGLQQLEARVPIGGYDAGPVPAEQVASAVSYDQSQVYDTVLTSPAPGTIVSLAYNELLVTSDATNVVGVG